ncbi:thymidine phosphorylase [candidate division KSB1 bacterium]|nr:thymidine phosphorylase [candidate division KSB1 bacterium]
MTAEQIIIKKRDGLELKESEIQFVINGLLQGDVTEYQMSALLMAIYFQGMTFDEIYLMTKTMVESGERVDLSHLDKFPVDKHSTGGVGDKVSLILAPLMAAAGLAIPMMSGRGLGHSGGTLDKLEAIPGFRINLPLSEYVSLLEKIGVAMIGQNENIAPADRLLYALRDSTGTVPSIPLVVCSIMSKKIAEGAKGLVLDVKVGKGAFFHSLPKALELTNKLIAIGGKFDLKTTALVTAMDQPLGNAVGNWLETREAINTLKGNGPDDLVKVTIALGAEMLCLAKKTKDISEAEKTLNELLLSGKAYDKFLEMVKEQNGDVSVTENPNTYPESKYNIRIVSKSDGYIHAIDSLKIGLLAMELGAGRIKMTDEIDYRAGFVLNKKEGDAVGIGELLVEAAFSKEMSESYIENKVLDAFQIKDQKPNEQKLILKYVNEKGAFEWQGNS